MAIETKPESGIPPNNEQNKAPDVKGASNSTITTQAAAPLEIVKSPEVLAEEAAYAELIAQTTAKVIRSCQARPSERMAEAMARFDRGNLNPQPAELWRYKSPVMSSGGRI